MPVRRGTMRRVPRMRGRGIVDILKKANAFLRKHKVISRGAAAVSPLLPAKFQPWATKIGGVSSALGYGRRRGGSLRLAGSGMRPYI